MRDIVLVTDASSERDEVRRELEPLLHAFAAAEVKVRLAAWDDPSFDWAGCAAVLRTPWDYHLRVHEFLAWARRVPRLYNPAHVVEWNACKTYLRELAASGVATVPTEWLEREAPLGQVLSRLGWAEAVLKPSVSAGAFRTRRFSAADAASNQPLLREILAGCPAMLQPYLPSVESSGARSLVYFAGALSHAVKRHPPLETGLQSGVALTPEPDEVALARAALAAAPGPLLYARVDVARDESGAPRLMELELIEPSFFLETAPGAAERFAEAVTAQVSCRRRRPART